MFRIGVITDQISIDLNRALGAVAELGLNQVEIHSIWGKSVEDLTDEEAEKAKKLIDEWAFRVSNISPTSFLMCSLEDDRKELEDWDDYFMTKHGSYSEHVESLKRSIALSKVFDTNRVRIFGFHRGTSFSNEEIMEKTAAKIAEIARIAEKSGVILMLENCPYTSLDTMALTSKIVKRINSKNLKLLWDPANTMSVGKKPFPDDYSQGKDYIVHIHLKDKARNKWGELESVPIGRGEINYRGIFEALKEDNYQGTLSLAGLFLRKRQVRRKTFSKLEDWSLIK
jgi:L-ribulose-5-phosphate 3-epimerase